MTLPEHRDHRLSEMDPREAGLLLKSVVIPRPIAWVGTVSSDGVTNLAPHSYFTMVSADPPIILFSATRLVGTLKDTATNVLATGEFTVSLVSWPLRTQANRTSARLGPESSEFDDAELTPLPSHSVSAPGVAESPAILECQLHRAEDVGDATVFFGQVLHVRIDETALRADDRGRALPDPALLDPVTRLGRNEWARLGDVFTQDRP
ncbi:flavin reductase family protein [Citricoccus muralis]|uniref:Flavin reductase family protein n=1 Tax=Citricoccus muralis TaxID=169134 RepID=A0ABY8H6N7_9MICC|nr:flavin reductase family protein [Citricoccus muralis]WFP16333.1 flavin reductase family protein [Citricoccus muralis]